VRSSTAAETADEVWDASAIVPLLMAEPATSTVQALAAKDPSMLVWWATEVECASAVARLEREGALGASAVAQAFDRLKQLASGWHEVDPSDSIREAAVRFLRVHPLRSAEALQLAATFLAAEAHGGLTLIGRRVAIVEPAPASVGTVHI